MENTTSFARTERHWGEPLAFAGLGIAAVIMMVVAISSSLDFVTKRDQVTMALSARTPTIEQGETALPAS